MWQCHRLHVSMQNSANKMLELTEMSTHKKSSEWIHAWRWWWISDLEFKYARTHSLALCLARVYSSSHLNSIDYLNRWIKHNWSILVEWASCCILLSCLFIALNLIRPSKYLCTWMRVRKKRQTNKQSQKNEVKSNKCVLWVTDRHTHTHTEAERDQAATLSLDSIVSCNVQQAQRRKTRTRREKEIENKPTWTLVLFHSLPLISL